MNKSKAQKSKPLRKTVFTDKPGKKITQDREEIASVAYEKKIEEIYGYIKQGMRTNEIYAMLSVENNSLNESKFVKMMQDAFIYADAAVQKDREYVFNLHMNRYEDIYEKSMQAVEGYTRPTTNHEWIQWRTIVTKYSQALSALNHKEDLLGLHDKKMVLEFNDNRALVMENDEGTKGDGVVGYDLEALSLEEQVELLALIKDCRTVPIEGIQRVTIKKTTIEISANGELERGIDVRKIDHVETKDIEFEEMPMDVVSKMKNVEVVMEEEEVPVDSIKDEIDRKKMPVPKTRTEIATAMQEKLLKQFKEKLKKNKP